MLLVFIREVIGLCNSRRLGPQMPGPGDIFCSSFCIFDIIVLVISCSNVVIFAL